MRYASQNYELQVAVEADRDRPSLPDVETLKQLFFAVHEQAYGFHNPADPVDVAAVRLTALGYRPSPGTPPLQPGASPTPKPRAKRRVWFEDPDPIETPVYDRASFAPGTRIEGPAVIDQFD